MDKLLSAAQSPKNPEDGRPKTSFENGFLAMKSLHSSSEPSIASNQVSAEVTPDYEAAIKQPSQLSIDKNLLYVDAVNQMDLDILAEEENVGIGTFEMKEPLVASEPVLEYNSNDIDMV